MANRWKDWKRCTNSFFGSIFLYLAFLQQPVISGQFVNLGFEDFDPNTLDVFSTSRGYVEGRGPTSGLIPGWQLTRGGVTDSNIFFNYIPLDVNFGILVTKDATNARDARFHFDFTNGKAALNLTFSGSPYSVSQVGEIPADAKFISYTYATFPYKFTINGTDQTPISTTESDPILHEGMQSFDVSRFAGQSALVTFTTQGPGGYIDNIVFSVPEIKTGVLFLIGIGVSGLTGICRKFGGARDL